MKFFLIQWANLPVNGMAIFPFILVRNKSFATSHILINHEKIHLKQQLELLILPFYIAYLFHYVINLIIYKNHDQAYMNIVFEKEAYLYEKNLDYLKERTTFAWICLLTKKQKMH